MPGIIDRQAELLLRGTHPAFLIPPPHRAAAG
jgi:hypothetical protein